MARYTTEALARAVHPLYGRAIVSVATAMYADGDYEAACALIAQAVNAAAKGEGDRDGLALLLGAERVITTLSFTSLRRRRRRAGTRVRLSPPTPPA